MPKIKSKWQQALDTLTPAKRKSILGDAQRLRRETLIIPLQSGRKANVNRKSVLVYLKSQ
jgi:hypothetical protein